MRTLTTVVLSCAAFLSERSFSYTVSLSYGASAVSYTHLNKVPFIVYGADVTMKEGDFGLSNVAAVVTDLLDLPADEHWNESIINKK